MQCIGQELDSEDLGTFEVEVVGAAASKNSVVKAEVSAVVNMRKIWSCESYGWLNSIHYQLEDPSGSTIDSRTIASGQKADIQYNVPKTGVHKMCFEGEVTHLYVLETMNKGNRKLTE